MELVKVDLEELKKGFWKRWWLLALSWTSVVEKQLKIDYVKSNAVLRALYRAHGHGWEKINCWQRSVVGERMEKSVRFFSSVKWRAFAMGEKAPLYFLSPTKITLDSSHIHSQSFTVPRLQRSTCNVWMVIELKLRQDGICKNFRH